jgi:hypothetical protein
MSFSPASNPEQRGLTAAKRGIAIFESRLDTSQTADRDKCPAVASRSYRS